MLKESIIDVKDSVHLFKEKMKKQIGGEDFDDFPDFEYIPMN